MLRTAATNTTCRSTTSRLSSKGAVLLGRNNERLLRHEERAAGCCHYHCLVSSRAAAAHQQQALLSSSSSSSRWPYSRRPLCPPFVSSSSSSPLPPRHSNTWTKRINTTTTQLRRGFQDKLSHRQRADLESRLISNVGNRVQDETLQRSVSSLGWLSPRLEITPEGDVHISLVLPSLLHPDLQGLKDAIKREAEKEVEAWKREQHEDSSTSTAFLSGIVHVESTAATLPVPLMARLAEDPEELLEMLGPGLQNVGHFLAVYSCKGGVGKSTVAVNLAYELATHSSMGGARIGLLDLDIYGPSLPVLIRPDNVEVRRSDKGKGMVHPIEHCGVKVLSMGFVNNSSGVPGSGQDNGAAIMRGPMAGKVVTQLLKGTDWGPLDVLILDLPPGTGDVQLAVCQELAVSGAVAVTTPSKLAAVDTQKGIEMFTSLGVPTLAVVQNMSYFECEGGGKHYPFGKGLSAADSDDIDGGASLTSSGTSIIQMPISTITHEANDAGEPLCLARPEAATFELDAFERLAKAVSRELLKIHYGETETQRVVMLQDGGDSTDEFGISTVHLNLDVANKSFLVRFFSASGACQKRVSAAGLRARDPKTGDVLQDSPFQSLLISDEDTTSASSDEIVTVHKTTNGTTAERDHPSLSPTKVDKKGRYGYAVQWADGATIIYSKQSIARAAGATIIEE